MHDSSQSNASPNLIFVGGVPRSGTTLIQRVLNSHPDVYGGPEFDFVPQIIELVESMRSSIRKGRISHWLAEDDLVDACREFVRRLFRQKAIDESVPYISEKTPANGTVFPQLASLFPECKLVFVVRDPRAIAASLKQVAISHRKLRKTPPEFTRTATNRAKCIDHYLETVAELDRSGVHVTKVCYEDVVLSPESTSKKLFADLGLRLPDSDFDEIFQKATTDVTTETGSLAGWYTPEDVTRGIDANSLQKWKQSLRRRDLAALIKHVTFRDDFHGRYNIDAKPPGLIGNAWLRLEQLLDLRFSTGHQAKNCLRAFRQGMFE